MTRVFSNRASPSGGALNLLQGSVFFRGYTHFSENTASDDGGAIYSIGTAIHMQERVKLEQANMVVVRSFLKQEHH